MVVAQEVHTPRKQAFLPLGNELSSLAQTGQSKINSPILPRLTPSHPVPFHHPCLGFPLSVAAAPAAGLVSDAWVIPAAWATAAMVSMARERLGAVLAAEKALKRVFAVDV